MNYLKWTMIASSVLAIACSLELARQLARTRYAVEQLNMRLGLVEAVQTQARADYEQRLADRLKPTYLGGPTDWTNLTNGVADFKRKARWVVGNTNSLQVNDYTTPKEQIDHMLDVIEAKLRARNTNYTVMESEPR